MGRVTDSSVCVGLLLLLLPTCHASISVNPRAKAKADPNCVSVRTGYGLYGGTSEAATCGFAETLQSRTESLERQARDLEQTTGERIAYQRGQVEALTGDVASLQGKDSALRPLFLTLFGSVEARVCEIHTHSEAMEWARLAFNDTNPDVHWVHLPCGDDCPLNFIKIRPGCYRPNDPAVVGPVAVSSPLFTCPADVGDGVFDPENLCTREVFITNRGYTTNVDRENEVFAELLDLSALESEESVAQALNAMPEPFRRMVKGGL